MSGTNAHVVLGPADPPPADDVPDPVPPTGFELSARTPQALRVLAARFGDRLAAAADRDYPAFAYTATAGRARHAVRARVAAADRAAALAALAAVASGTPSPAVTLAEGASAGDPAPVPPPRRVLDLPHYPWERQRHAPAAGAAAAATVVVEEEGAPAEFYGLEWEPVPAPAAAVRDTVVLAGDDVELLALLARAADARGLPAVVLDPAGADGALPRDRAGWEAFLTGRPAGERAALVLAMRATPLPDPAAGTADPAASGARLCAAVGTAVLALARAGAPGTAFAVTRGARQVTGTDPVVAGDHGLLQGLAPVLGLEAGRCWGGVVDLPAAPGPRDAAALLELVAGGTGEDLAAIRAGRVLGARIVPLPPTRTARPPVRAEATYLVTGGLGAVGRAVTAGLVRHGARHLLLIGRTPPERLGPEAAGLLAALRADGVDARYRAADCDRAAELAAACGELDGMPPVRGVVHAAGTLTRTPLAEADTAVFAAALRGKFTGAWWLHLLSRDWPLDFFVPTSSVSALWGSEGYGGYAAANGGLDALAALRAAAGLPAVSIGFGPWAVPGGMVGEAARDGLARTGLAALRPAAGADAVVAPPGTAPLLAACAVDWPRFTAVMEARRSRPLFARMTEVRVTPGTALAVATGSATGMARAADSAPAIGTTLALGTAPAADAAPVTGTASPSATARTSATAPTTGTAPASSTAPAAGIASAADAAPATGTASGVATGMARVADSAPAIGTALAAATAPVTGTASAIGIAPEAPAALPEAAQALLALPERARPAAARARVRALTAAVLGHTAPGAVRDDTGFFDLGLDSLTAVDLGSGLTAAFGVDVRVGDVFDHPTVGQLAAHLLDLLHDTVHLAPAAYPAPAHPAPAAAPVRPADVRPADVLPADVLPAAEPSADERSAAVLLAPRPSRLVLDRALGEPVRPADVRPTDALPADIPAPRPPQPTPDRAVSPAAGRAAGDPVAVVGMAGRFPGADSVEELWDLLCAGPRRRRAGPGRSGHRAAPTGCRPARSPPTRAASCATSHVSTPRSSGSRRARRRASTRSTGWCWRPPGTRWRTPRSPRAPSAAAAPASTSASPTPTTPDCSNSGGPQQVDAYYGTGTALNAAAGRIAYLLGLRRPGARRRHRLLLLAGRAAPGDPFAAGGRDRLRAGRRRQRHCSRPPVRSRSAGRTCSRRAAGAGPSPRRPTGSSAPRAAGCWCSSGSPTRGATATGCSPSCTAARSTRTAHPPR